MIPISKLKSNLKQSQNWQSTFRQQIKTYLQELTTKNQQICQYTKDNKTKSSEIQKRQGELKCHNEEKQKIVYKTDKIKIKLEELENRLRVYEEGCKKKEDWKNELINKVKGLERTIRKERLSQQSDLLQQNQDQIQDVSLSNISCNSLSSESHLSDKKPSARKPHPETMFADVNLKRVNQLERQYLKQVARCKEIGYKIEVATQKEQRLKQLLSEISLKDQMADKENRPNTDQNRQGKETLHQNIDKLKEKLSQRQRQSNNLNLKISAKHAVIERYGEILQKIVVHDNQYLNISKQVNALQRQVKKQRNTMLNIANYLLKQHTTL